MRALPGVVLGGAAMALSACSGSGALSERDVYTIVDELDVAVRAEALAEPMVLLASGAAMDATTPEEAATRTANALAQLPCVEVTRVGPTTLSIVYSASLYTCGSGALGSQFSLSGQETMSFVQADGAITRVDHTWQAITNGYLTIDGTARVTTSQADGATTEREVNTLSWVRASDGKSGHGQDDRTSPVKLLTDGQIFPTGLRTWESDAGTWQMRPIDARLQDPTTQIPFVGSFAVVTPEGRALTLSMTYDAKGAHLTLTDGSRSYSFGFSPGGVPTE